MATVTRTVYPRAHSTVGDSWDNLGNIVAADDSYANGTAIYGEYRQLWVYFSGAALPDTAVARSVTIETKYYVSNPDANVEMELRSRYGANFFSGQTDTTNPTTGKIFSIPGRSWTVAELNSGSAGGRVSISALTDGQTSLVYFDYIRLVIEYDIVHNKALTVGVQTSAMEQHMPVTVHEKTVTAITTTAGTAKILRSQFQVIYPTGHATVGGTWSNPGNIYTDNGSYATISPTRNDTGQILNVTFPSAALPAEAEITTVSAQIEWRSSRTNAEGGIQAGYDGVLRGTEGMDTATRTNTDQVFTNTDVGAWTVAELNSGLAYAAVRAFRPSSLSTTISFDYACLIVEYTMPEEEEPQEYHKTVTAGSGVLAAVAEKAIGKPVRATTLLSAIANKGFFKTLVTGVSATASAAKSHIQNAVIFVKEVTNRVAVTPSVLRAFVKVVTAVANTASNVVKHSSKAVTAVANTASNVVKHSSKAVTTAVHVGATAGRAIAKTVRAIVVVPAKAVKHVGKAAKTCVAAKSRVVFPFASLRYAAVSWEERETALEVRQGVVVLSVTEAHTELEVI